MTNTEINADTNTELDFIDLLKTDLDFFFDENRWSAFDMDWISEDYLLFYVHPYDFPDKEIAERFGFYVGVDVVPSRLSLTRVYESLQNLYLSFNENDYFYRILKEERKLTGELPNAKQLLEFTSKMEESLKNLVKNFYMTYINPLDL